jgi:hypothetical protein
VRVEMVAPRIIQAMVVAMKMAEMASMRRITKTGWLASKLLSSTFYYKVTWYRR